MLVRLLFFEVDSVPFDAEVRDGTTTPGVLSFCSALIRACLIISLAGAASTAWLFVVSPVILLLLTL